MTDEKTQGKVKLRSAMLTDIGMVREHNEDCALIDDAQRFFIVADGMGGHAAGEVASAMAVEGVRDALSSTDHTLKSFSEFPTVDGRQLVAQVLEEAVRKAHKSVFDCGSSNPDKEGMGTTLDVLLVSGQEAFVAHVGDSRTYLMRGNSAAQITTDHTVAEVLVIEGKLSAEEALVSPLRTILVNALGVSAEVGVEMAHLTLHKGDRILICSDGLHDYFPQEEELYEQVTQNAPDVALAKLIDTAKDRGGQDNITAIIIDVLDAPEVKETITAPIPVTSTNPASSDGVPQAPLSSDDTAPFDESQLGDIETQHHARVSTRLSTEPFSSDDQNEVDQEEKLYNADLRRTIPNRRTPAPPVDPLGDTLDPSLEIEDD